MRLARFTLVTGLFALTTSACTTPSESPSDTSYDGTVESMDSLPDCGPDSLGSLFWVKETNGAYECKSPSTWEQRKNAKRPDDEVEAYGDSEALSPRIVK